MLVGNLRLLRQNVLNAGHGRGSPREDINNPAQRNDGPGELHHEYVERRETAQRDSMQQHLAPANPEHDDDRHPSSVSSVGQSIPIRRTSFRLRPMYSVFWRSKLSISA